jgi:hypothetical protein
MIYDEGYQGACGCPGVVPGGACPRLCLDGSVVTNPDLLSGVGGKDCGVLDLLLPGTTDSSNCDQLATSLYRDHCGCAELCTFCADGATPTGVILASGNFQIL